MQIDNEPPPRQAPTCDEHDGLLFFRMAMLGLDPHAVARGYSMMFDKLKRQCTSCRSWEACVVDLKRDPNNPVWEGYCPNFGTLNEFAAFMEALGMMDEGR